MVSNIIIQYQQFYLILNIRLNIDKWFEVLLSNTRFDPVYGISSFVCF